MAKPQPQGWHAEDIKAALRKRYRCGITRLSASWGLSRTAISTALAGKKRSAPVERRIAEALDEHPHTLWPERWSPSGHPQHPPCGRKPTRPGRVPHRQIEEAA